MLLMLLMTAKKLLGVSSPLPEETPPNLQRASGLVCCTPSKKPTWSSFQRLKESRPFFHRPPPLLFLCYFISFLGQERREKKKEKKETHRAPGDLVLGTPASPPPEEDPRLRAWNGTDGRYLGPGGGGRGSRRLDAGTERLHAGRFPFLGVFLPFPLSFLFLFVPSFLLFFFPPCTPPPPPAAGAGEGGARRGARRRARGGAHGGPRRRWDGSARSGAGGASRRPPPRAPPQSGR